MQINHSHVSPAFAHHASNNAIKGNQAVACASDSRLPLSRCKQPSSASFDIHDFPLLPIPIVMSNPRSTLHVFWVDFEHHKALNLYEPLECA